MKFDKGLVRRIAVCLGALPAAVLAITPRKTDREREEKVLAAESRLPSLEAGEFGIVD